MNPVRVLFLGPPGAGKGTQAMRISERCHLPVIGSGDLLRREIKSGSELGRQAALYMEAGRLVPDSVITGVMVAGIVKLPDEAGFLLDGFPRTAPQAEALEKGLHAAGRDLSDVVYLTADDERIIARMVDRRICSNCQKDYNVRSSPPRVAGVCDRCGQTVVQRPDDTESVIRTRLETYRRQTAPLVSFYRQRGLLREINGEGAPEMVESAIVAALTRTDKGRC